MPPEPHRTRLIVDLQGVKQEAQEQEGRRITYAEIAEACGVKVGAIRKVAYPGTGYRPSWLLVERLINLFDAKPERLIQRVDADPETGAPIIPANRAGRLPRHFGSAARGPSHDYDPERLKRLVSAYLQDEGVSQAELARRAGVSPPGVGFVLKGQRIGAESLAKLTNVVGGEQ